MNELATVLFGPGIFSVGIVTLVAMPIAFELIRRKGHSPVIAGSVAVLCGLAAFALAFSSLFVERWSVAMMLAAGSPACLALAFGVVKWLPRKGNRIFGERRPFRFDPIGYTIMAAGALLFGFIVFYDPIENATIVTQVLSVVIAALIGALVALPVGLPFITRGRVGRAIPTLEAELANDGRGPVLYIRSFGMERGGFVVGAKSKYGRYQRRFVDSPKIQWVVITFEQYLGETIRRDIGPFVALGSPEDYLPPLGAARKYAEDATWQQDFERLLTTAAAIVVDIATSQNLKWEFSCIRAHGLQERLFLVTRHASTFSGSGRFWLARRLERRMGRVPVSWAGLSSALNDLGYRLASESPGPGSVVTFDADGSERVLVANADLPEDFVRPMVDHLATLRERMLTV